MNIIDFIPYGKENAVSRYEIALKMGTSERDVRASIKRANADLERTREAILSSSGGRGYWRTSSIEEMERYLRESAHRRDTLAKNDFPILLTVCRAKGEKLVPVRAHYRRLNLQPDQMRL